MRQPGNIACGTAESVVEGLGRVCGGDGGGLLNGLVPEGRNNEEGERERFTTDGYTHETRFGGQDGQDLNLTRNTFFRGPLVTRADGLYTETQKTGPVTGYYLAYIVFNATDCIFVLTSKQTSEEN